MHTLTYQGEIVLRVHELTAWTDRWHLLIWSPVNLWQGGCYRGRCRTSYTVGITRGAGGLLLVGWKYWLRGATGGRGCCDGGRLNDTGSWTTGWLRPKEGEAVRKFKT